MRKLDLVVVIAVIAAGSALFTRPLVSPEPPPSPAAVQTPPRLIPGKFQVLPCPVRVAGVPLGCTEAELRRRMGDPEGVEPDERDPDGRTLTYPNVDALIKGDLLIGMGGGGPFVLTGGSSPRGLGASRVEVETALGGQKPLYGDAGSATYEVNRGQLTYHFDDDGRVSQIWLIGVLQPDSIDHHSSKR